MWSTWGVRDGEKEMNDSSGSCQSTKGSWPAGGALTSLIKCNNQVLGQTLFQCWLCGPVLSVNTEKKKKDQSGSTLNPGTDIHSCAPLTFSILPVSSFNSPKEKRWKLSMCFKCLTLSRCTAEMKRRVTNSSEPSSERFFRRPRTKKKSSQRYVTF